MNAVCDKAKHACLARNSRKPKDHSPYLSLWDGKRHPSHVVYDRERTP